ILILRLSIFFQAEDGIRDTSVTGVQTCALPIYIALGGEIAGDADPLLAVVGGFEQVGLPIVIAMMVDGDVSRAGVEVGGPDAGDVGVALGRAGDIAVHVGEGFAAILADLQVAVFGADPDDAGFGGGLADLRGHGTGRVAVVLGGHGLIAGHAHDGEFRRPAVDALGKIGGIHPPGVAAVVGLEEVLAGHVHHGWIVRRDLKWGIPIEAQRVAVGRRVDHVRRSTASAATTAAS